MKNQKIKFEKGIINIFVNKIYIINQKMIFLINSIFNFFEF